MDGLTEGRIVHYVLKGGRSEGQHRPAIVVKCWRSPNYEDMIQLQVFTDYTNDFLKGEYGSEGQLWATSVHYSEDKIPGTWHWIEKA